MRTLSICLAVAAAATQACAQEGTERALQIARTSPTAVAAASRVRAAAASIGDRAIRAAMLDLLDNPAPTFLARFADAASKDAVVAKLKAEGLAPAELTAAQLFPPIADPKHAAQPFLAAPAQQLGGHHDYPGGLAEHTAFNLDSAVALAANYRATYGFDRQAIDEDYVIAAPIAHDILKTYVLQWQADGSLTVQGKIGGTVSHHIFDVAEVLHRRLPAELAVVVASAHESPFGEGASKVVGYLRAAAILADIDPIATGLLAREGGQWKLAKPPRIECAINHLSDHDYVLTDPTQPLVEAALDRVLGPQAEPRWARYRALAALPGVRIYEAWRARGDAGVRAELVKRGALAQ